MLPHSLVLFSALSAVFVPATVHAALNVSYPTVPPASAMMNIVDDNFLGISFELSSFDTLWGSTTSKIPSAILNYLANIRARQTLPLRIRVGGNGMDGSVYDPSLKSEMLKITDDSYYNDILVDFGPVFFDVLNEVYDAVGSMQFMIGLSMRDPHNPNSIIPLAKAAEEKLGDRLDVMLLGNEPDLYAGHGTRDQYGISDYIPELNMLFEDLETQGLLPKNILGGPTICCAWELSDLLDAGMKDLPYKYYTLQHYPNNRCGGENEKNTNTTFYQHHSNLQDYILKWNQDGVMAAKEQNVPVLLTEYNTVSCGGTNISETFVSSLWAVDAGLAAAAKNYSAAYIHTREHGIQYNLFDPPTSETSSSPDWHTGSTYYSALFLAEVFSSTGTVIVDLVNSTSVYNSTTSKEQKGAVIDPETDLDLDMTAVYGVYEHAGTLLGKLALINYSDKGSSRSGDYNKTYDSEDSKVTFHFALPEGAQTEFAYRLMLAPSVDERTEISWAGQTVGWNGILEGAQMTGTGQCEDGMCSLEVPSPGAALVMFNPNGEQSTDVFWVGNATVSAESGVWMSTRNGAGRVSFGWCEIALTTSVILFSSLLGVGW